MTEALDQERITPFEAELAALTNQQVRVQQQLHRLTQPDDTLQHFETIWGKWLGEVSKRLDLAKEVETLQTRFQRTQADRNASETATVKRDARERLRAEDSRKDTWLGFVPSEGADEVTGIMQSSYETLIALESKLANLGKQRALTERLIEVTESEKGTIIEYVLFLQKVKTQYAAAEAEEWVSMQAALRPHKAEALLRAFATKTGTRLATPPPIAEADKADAIAAAAKRLFIWRTKFVAIKKWIRVSEQLLSDDGLDGEIGTHQDHIGALDAQAAALHRRMYRLTGHPESALATMAPEEQPQTEADRRDVLQGEIGVLRIDRANLRQQALVRIVIKLASIVLTTLVLMWILNCMVNRASKRHEDSKANDSAQSVLMLSFLSVFLRVVMWTAAVVMIFNTLGFKVTALLAGLGIGGLAIAMAARETLANILGGMMIFLERPFILGDTIQVGAHPPAKVLSMNWRATSLTDPFDYHFSVPNREVADATLKNFTRMHPVGDYFSLYVSPEHNPDTVILLVNQALEACDDVLQYQTKYTMLAGVTTVGNMTVMEYWPCWYTDDYHIRYRTRARVWRSIWTHLAEAGITLEIKPYEIREGADRDV